MVHPNTCGLRRLAVPKEGGGGDKAMVGGGGAECFWGGGWHSILGPLTHTQVHLYCTQIGGLMFEHFLKIVRKSYAHLRKTPHVGTKTALPPGRGCGGVEGGDAETLSVGLRPLPPSFRGPMDHWAVGNRTSP